MCVKTCVARNGDMRCDSKREPFIFSFLHRERETSREKEAKKFFCPPRTRDFNSPNSSFVPRENTYVKRPRLADTDAHAQRDKEIKR